MTACFVEFERGLEGSRERIGFFAYLFKLQMRFHTPEAEGSMRRIGSFEKPKGLTAYLR